MTNRQTVVTGLLAANLVLADGLAFGGWTTRAI